MNKKLLIGLGNIGEEYFLTRHNVGSDFLNYLSKDYTKKNKPPHLVGTFREHGIEATLIKPLGFMNVMGPLVLKIINYYKVESTDIIIVHDDLDIEVGFYKISFARGSAGHKGVASIIDTLKSNEHYRIRIGIGKPANANYPIENYVLENIPSKEKEKINALYPLIKTELLGLLK